MLLYEYLRNINWLDALSVYLLTVPLFYSVAYLFYGQTLNVGKHKKSIIKTLIYLCLAPFVISLIKLFLQIGTSNSSVSQFLFLNYLNFETIGKTYLFLGAISLVFPALHIVQVYIIPGFFLIFGIPALIVNIVKEERFNPIKIVVRCVKNTISFYKDIVLADLKAASQICFFVYFHIIPILMIFFYCLTVIGTALFTIVEPVISFFSWFFSPILSFLKIIIYSLPTICEVLEKFTYLIVGIIFCGAILLAMLGYFWNTFISKNKD